MLTRLVKDHQQVQQKRREDAGKLLKKKLKKLKKCEIYKSFFKKIEFPFNI